MPFKWFRRRKPEREQAPSEAAAPPSEVPETTAAPRAAGTTDTTRSPSAGAARAAARAARSPARAAVAEARREARETRATARPLAGRRAARAAAQGTRRTRPAAPPRDFLAARRCRPRSASCSSRSTSSEQRVAVLEDGRVAEVYLERPERRSIAGNIYLGTVDNVLPGMEAAFVEIGLEKNGFLYVDEIVRPELEGHRHGKRIQDLLSRGEQVLVQAVKDPMKSKGARLTMEISLPGRFVVFVPNGEGLGVSRRLEDDERARLKDILKTLAVKEGGVIVRTAAEGASAEDIERDLVFLQKLWKTI